VPGAASGSGFGAGISFGAGASFGVDVDAGVAGVVVSDSAALPPSVDDPAGRSDAGNEDAGTGAPP